MIAKFEARNSNVLLRKIQMQAIVQQRCFNHRFREAAARCPECGRFFCRECITEHEDKVLCAACIRKRLGSATVRFDRFQRLIQVGHFLLGILIVYIIFYYLAQVLLSLPASFHEGTLWQVGWWADS